MSSLVYVFLHAHFPVNVPSPWSTQSPPQTLHASTMAFWLGSVYHCPLQSGVHVLPVLPVFPPTHTLHLSRARKVLGWPKRCKLAHAFLWEDSYKRLQLAQLLGQLGVFLT